MGRGRKPPLIHTLLTTFVVGFAAFTFLRMWSDALPDLFGNAVLRDSWVPLSGFVGVLLGYYYFRMRPRPGGSAWRIFSSTVVAFGLAGIPVWQLLRVTGKAPEALMAIGIASTWALTVLMALITFGILLVPGFIFGGFLTLATETRGESRTRYPGTHLIWPLFLGLAVGAPVLVFGMLPNLSDMACMVIAAGASAATGLVGFLMGRPAVQEHTLSDPDTPGTRGKQTRSAVLVPHGIYVFAVITWLVLWFRLCLIAAGPSLQALAALFTALFAGVALGWLVSANASGRKAGSAIGMGIVAGATGVLLLFLTRWAWRLPMLFLEALGEPPLIWEDMIRGYFSLAFLTVFAPAILMGTLLQISLGVRYANKQEGAHPSLPAIIVGIVLALTITRFLPGQHLSLKYLIIATSWICVAAGLAHFALSRARWPERLAWMAPLAVAAVIIGITQPTWNSAYLAHGIYTMPGEFRQVRDAESLFGGMDLVFHQVDRDRIVSVDRTPDAITMRVNGSARVSAEGSMIPHLMAGHVPLLLSEHPRKVFLGGLDGGLTLRSIEAYPVEEIRCVESSEAVVRAARLFSAYNGDALNDARLKILVRDVANELLYSSERYDVIILKSPLSYSYAAAGRFSLDFLRLVRSRLAPGGVVCQQINTFELSVTSLRSLGKSFAYYFPHVSIWWIGGDKILLLGSSRPFPSSEDLVQGRMSVPEVQAELARIRLTDPVGVLSCFMMQRQGVSDFAGGAPLPVTGYHGMALDWPQRALEVIRTDGLEELILFREPPTAFLEDKEPDSPEYKVLKDRFNRCEAGHRFFVESLVSLREGKIREAVSQLSEAPTLCPQNGIYVFALADYYVVLSKSLVGAGRMEEALAAARRSVELLPSSPRSFYNLASIERARDPATAVLLLDRAIQLNPYYVPAYLLKAESQLATGNPKEAAQTVGEVLTMEPFNTRAHHLRGLSFTRRGMYAEGRAELQMVLDAEPDNLEAMEAFAYNWLLDEELDQAENLYRQVLEREPDNLGALNNYATILAEKERYREAVRVWTRALELSPGNTNIINNIEEARQSMRQ